MTTTPKAPELLAKAAAHMADRATTYDKPEGERSMGRAVQAFNAITGRDLSEPEGWLLLQVLKDVRLFQRPGYHADSAEDCIAYAALKAEAKASDGVVVGEATETKPDHTSHARYGDCHTCKRWAVSYGEDPCKSCLASEEGFPNWEPASDNE